MKILFLCNKSPYPPAEGSPLAMYHMIESMIGLGHQVKVLAVNSEKFNIDPKRIPEDFKKRTQIEYIELDLRIRPWPALIKLLKKQSYHASRFQSIHLTDKLKSVLRTNDFDIVQLETLYMGHYISLIRKHSRAKIILRAHNLEHEIWERLARGEQNKLKKWYLLQLVKTLKAFECEVFERVDGIAAISNRDEASIRALVKTPVATFTFGINPDEYKPKALPEKPDLFHLGSMNWAPNLEGIQWFLDQVWPLIISQHPNIQCHLAGSHMPDHLVKRSDKNLRVQGRVEDAHHFIGAHAIAVVPLLSGSGIRIKIIEAMALGRVVVSTSTGAEGIAFEEGVDIRIADKPEAFAQAVSELINHWEQAKNMGKHARKLIERDHNRSKIAKELESFYRKISDF